MVLILITYWYESKRYHCYVQEILKALHYFIKVDLLKLIISIIIKIIQDGKINIIQVFTKVSKNIIHHIYLIYNILVQNNNNLLQFTLILWFSQ